MSWATSTGMGRAGGDHTVGGKALEKKREQDHGHKDRNSCGL